MKILITNCDLAHRRGTELFVRDLTRALICDGHTVYVYSTLLGAVADECRSIGAIVTDDLHTLDSTPDVIHGHHYTTVFHAALRFPSVPMVYVCHGIIPTEEWPVRLPGIKRYIAVSNLTRARIAEATGIGIQDVAIISNFVDLNRFKNQRILPARPTKALLFGNYWKTKSYEYDAIAEACRCNGISSIEVRGESETVAVKPENELPNYDVVFAVGRSAIEAMGAGSAVILADLHGIGGMVTPANFDSLRFMNFGLEATRKNSLTSDSVYKNLLMYDRIQAEIVTSRVRTELNLDVALSKWKDAYIDAIVAQQKDKPILGATFATYSTVVATKWRSRASAAAFAGSLTSFILGKIGSFIESSV